MSDAPVMATGHIPDSYDPNDKSVDMDIMHMTAITMPEKFNLFENVPEGPRTTPFTRHNLNQGSVGSCVANAVASAYIYELQRQGQDELAARYRPARLFLYYVARLAPDRTKSWNNPAEFYGSLSTTPPQSSEVELKDTGCMQREVVKIMKGLGAPEEAASVAAYEAAVASGSKPGTWPYQNVAAKAQPKLQPNDPEPPELFDPSQYPARVPDAECFQMAHNHMAIAYARPHLVFGQREESIKCWKQCIKWGYPVIFGLKVWDSFYQLSRAPYFVAPVPSEKEKEDLAKNNKKPGGHCVLAVGWNNSIQTAEGKVEGCFLVQNSWGEDRTLDGKGFFWLPYGWFDEDGIVNSPWTFMGSTPKV